MNYVNRYLRTILGILFLGMVVILLILLRYISKRQREPVTEDVTTLASSAVASMNSTADSAADEFAFDSDNKSALNIVDTIVESSGEEVPALQEAAEPDAAGTNAMQESSTEHEVEQVQETEALVERTEAYCVKCRQKREMQNASRIVTKNGRNAMEGTCPVCGTRLFRFIAR